MEFKIEKESLTDFVQAYRDEAAAGREVAKEFCNSFDTAVTKACDAMLLYLQSSIEETKLRHEIEMKRLDHEINMETKRLEMEMKRVDHEIEMDNRRFELEM